MIICLVLLAVPAVQGGYPEWRQHLRQGLVRDEFADKASTGRNVVIPRQLVLTSHDGTIDAMNPAVQKNVKHTLRLNPGFSMRLLSDEDCLGFIEKHYDESLAHNFKEELQGNFRGDICRAAVLAHEGGFYLDIDLELKVPLESLMDTYTTFVSAFDNSEAVYNAVLASVPKSPIMQQAITEIRNWYVVNASHSEAGVDSTQLGPVTTLRALHAVFQLKCPHQQVRPQNVLQQACGDQVVRMYREQPLKCPGTEAGDCPKIRAESKFDGVHYGIYIPNSTKLVGWSRFEGCKDWSCMTGGGLLRGLGAR